jgi:hypothetical protein
MLEFEHLDGAWSSILGQIKVDCSNKVAIIFPDPLFDGVLKLKLEHRYKTQFIKLNEFTSADPRCPIKSYELQNAETK